MIGPAAFAREMLERPLSEECEILSALDQSIDNGYWSAKNRLHLYRIHRNTRCANKRLRNIQLASP